MIKKGKKKIYSETEQNIQKLRDELFLFVLTMNECRNSNNKR